MRRNRSNVPGIIGLLLMILMLSVFLGYYLHKNEFRFRPNLNDTSLQPSTQAEAVDWNKVEKIRQYLIDNYNGPLSDKSLLEGSLKGMVSALDQGGGQYFNALEFKEITDREAMDISTGIHIGVSDGNLIVISVDPESESEAAGILPGDIIIKINGRLFRDTEIEKARGLMVSPVNGHVDLNILRGTKFMDFRVLLRKGAKPSILSSVKDGIGIIRIPSFYEGSGEDLKSVLEEFTKQNVHGIVLDLRNTPSGLLTEGVNIASQFIQEDQIVVSLRDTRGRIRDFLSSSGEYADLPLAVLVNGQTEGTAEFLAGAIAEKKGVSLIGEPTLGEGRIYSYINLSEGEGIKLISGYLLMPDDAEIHGRGILPDIDVKSPSINNNLPGLTEDSQLERALKNVKLRVED